MLVYFHGGDWTAANPGTYDSSARALTNAAGYIVVSVAYHLAPEHPFPAPARDAYASFRWVQANAARLGGIQMVAGTGFGCCPQLSRPQPAGRLRKPVD